MVRVAARTGLHPDDAVLQLAVDSREPPELGHNLHVLCPYTDKCNALCSDGVDAHRPSRMWTLRAALLSLRRQVRASGAVLGIAAGHLGYLLQLCRPLLSLLSEIFRLVYAYGDTMGTFSRDLDAELRVAAALLPLVVRDGGAGAEHNVLVSDFGLLGYALPAGGFEDELVSRALAARERWRFKHVRDGPPAASGAQAADCAGARGAFDLWGKERVSDIDRNTSFHARARASLTPALGNLTAPGPASPEPALRGVTEFDSHVDAASSLFGPMSVPPYRGRPHPPEGLEATRRRHVARLGTYTRFGGSDRGRWPRMGRSAGG